MGGGIMQTCVGGFQDSCLPSLIQLRQREITGKFPGRWNDEMVRLTMARWFAEDEAYDELSYVIRKKSKLN